MSWRIIVDAAENGTKEGSGRGEAITSYANLWDIRYREEKSHSESDSDEYENQHQKKTVSKYIYKLWAPRIWLEFPQPLTQYFSHLYRYPNGSKRLQFTDVSNRLDPDKMFVEVLTWRNLRRFLTTKRVGIRGGPILIPSLASVMVAFTGSFLYAAHQLLWCRIESCIKQEARCSHKGSRS